MPSRRNRIVSPAAALALTVWSGPAQSAPTLSNEQALGAQEHPKLVQQYGGAYRDPKVDAFVQSIGRRLAELFRIINDLPPGTPVQARPVVKVIAE